MVAIKTTAPKVLNLMAMEASINKKLTRKYTKLR
jgi:hypothetical protein